jgi:putative oxidoreductase
MSTTALTAPQTSGSASAAILVGRVLLSVMFILAGYAKLTGIAGTAGWLESLGIPAPTLAAVGSGLVELVGGLAILVGFQTRIAALILAAFTIAATLVAHTNLADQVQQLLFMKNLAVTGGFLVLAAVGAGALSIDARRG